MSPAVIGVSKLHMQFNNDQGQEVSFDYLELEVAPNLYAKINLTPNNIRVLQKYNPSLYQLISNISLGQQIEFKEVKPAQVKHLDGIYSQDDNANML